MAADSDKASTSIETQIALLRSGHLSDFTINCGDKEWKVHRSVICPQSRYFVAACKEEYLEGQNRVITREDDNPAAIARMVDYLYTSEFKYGKKSSFAELGKKDSLQKALDVLELYVLADKYDVPSLREDCRAVFKTMTSLWFFWELDDLYTVALEASASLPSNDMGILEDIVQACCHVLPRILNIEPSNEKIKSGAQAQKDIIQRDKWTALLHESPVLTTRILRETMVRSNDWQKKYHDKCSDYWNE